MIFLKRKRQRQQFSLALICHDSEYAAALFHVHGLHLWHQRLWESKEPETAERGETLKPPKTLHTKTDINLFQQTCMSIGGASNCLEIMLTFPATCYLFPLSLWMRNLVSAEQSVGRQGLQMVNRGDGSVCKNSPQLSDKRRLRAMLSQVCHPGPVGFKATVKKHGDFAPLL